MDKLWKDLRFAWRTLTRRPGFTVIAVLTLALGMGVNTAIFSVVDGVLLRPLPYPQPDRIVSVLTAFPSRGVERDIFSPTNYLELAEASKALEAVAAVDTRSGELTGDGEPEMVPRTLVPPSFFRVFGVSPLFGRTFTEQETNDRAGVVVLSEGLWQRRYGGNKGILGQKIRLDGASYTVVGVMPDSFVYPARGGIWTPLSFSADERRARGAIYLDVVARIKPGVSIAEAEAETKAIGTRLVQADPVINAGLTLFLEPMIESVTGPVRQPLLVLLVAVGFVLAVACANLANLMLASVAQRKREFAVRLALGVTRFGLVRQQLLEALVIAVAGTAAGLLIAYSTVPVLVRFAQSVLPRSFEVGIDTRVLLFSLAVALVTMAVTGIAPALAATRTDLTEALKEGSRGGGQSSARRRLANVLVVSEVALVLVMLVGAGLLLRSFAKLRSVDPGFKSDGLLAWQLFFPASRYKPVEAPQAYARVLESVRRLGATDKAALVSPSPFAAVPTVNDRSFFVEGKPEPPPGQQPVALFARASSEYFETMGIQLKAGRTFTDADRIGSAPVIIVSEEAVRRFWDNQNPVGRRVRFGRGDNARFLDVVGVVSDVRHNNLGRAPRPEMYVPLLQEPARSATLIVRSKNAPAALIGDLKSAVWQVDRDFPATNLGVMDTFIASSLNGQRFTLLLTGGFALLALILAMVGIYGVMARAVSQRTSEFGVRLAMGAQPQNLLGMVLRQGAELALTGGLIGLAGSIALTRFLKSLLYEVSAYDPVTFGGVFLLLLLSALAACYWPARRAASVDPLVSLRQE